jgi:hypothetical protein
MTELTTPQATQESKDLEQEQGSCTGVNPCRTHGFGIWGNPRVVMGVRVDKELKKRFTDVSKRVFGSTCNPIESFMAAIVGVYSNDNLVRVNPSNTVNIEKIVIERNLRERRKLEVEGSEGLCGVAGCREDAVGRGVWLAKGVEYDLCRVHFLEAKCNPKLWRVLHGGEF